jgi:GT2 family glycosyltransferase
MTGGRQPDVTVIIVTYNSASEISAAVASARAAAVHAGLDLELIIVDNASADETVPHAKAATADAIIIANLENVGFGRANNQAFERATGRHWLLLNPDARLEPPAMGALLAAIAATRGGGVAPSIGDHGAESCGMAPGIRSALGHFLFLNRLLPDDFGGAWRGFQLRRTPSTAPRPVEWASAAALLLDPDAVRLVNGFDPRFFLYGEDIDLGVRLTAAGRRLWVVPAARASHRIAGSQGGISTRWLDAVHLLYLARNGRLRTIAFDLIVAIGLTTRAMVEAAHRDGTRGVHAQRMRAASLRAWQLVIGRGSKRRAC